MIERRQLSEALARLDPRDREVLDYSLRRHVPDSDLAAVFDCGPSEVARMRAAAVERLADDLGVQRGADLGQVLTALLDEATWADLPAAAPLASEGRPPAAAPPPGETGRQAAPSADDPPPEGSTRVLGMLAADRADPRAREASGTESQAPAPARSGGRRWSLAAAAALIGVLVTVGLGSIVLLGDDAGSSGPGDENSATRPFEPQEEPLGEPFPSDPESAYRYPIAIIDRTTTLHDGPGGRPKLRIAAKTEWDSPRVLSVVERQGEWLAVLVPELANGEVGWLREGDVDRIDSVGWSIKADLRTREVTVERDGEVVRRVKAGIGREDHPTPTGRYAVTDKLKVTDPGSPYGCCVVALTGHQTKLPPGWPGGDRLAIHATNDPAGIGEAVSLGCLRIDPREARWMLNAVPLGTPVFITESEPPRRPTSQRKRSRR